MELIFKWYPNFLRFLTLILILFCVPYAGLISKNLSEPGYKDGELEGVCNMVFYNILPGEKPMAIYFDIKNGTIKSAIGMSREFNRVPYNIDFSDLTINDSTLSGAIGVKVNSDGYTPKDGKALMYRIHLNVVFRNGKAAGEYTGLCEKNEVKGIVSGELRPVKVVEPIRFVLDCENAIQDDASSKLYNRRTTFSMSIKDCKVYGARFDPVGSIVDVSMQIHVKSSDLKVEGTQLKLTTVSQIIRQKGDTIIATHIFDGSILGNVAAGTVRSWLGDKESPEPGSFLGKVTTGLAPIKSGNCLYSVVLYDVLPRGGYFKLFLSSTSGIITHGFATSPNSSNFTHSIDISELKLNGSKLSGVVKVALKPDSWTSYKTPLCIFSINADIIDTEIMGSYTGSINNGDIKGDIDGSLYLKPLLSTRGRMTIKLENGLTGGKEWENRAFLNFDFNEDEILKGNISNNHTDMKGTVDNGQVKIDENQISFEVSITAAMGGNVDTGNYNFKGIGTVVGVYCAGSFQTFRDNKFVKEGNFWAILPEYNKETKNSLPVAWITYKKVESLEKDFADIIAHGVGLVSMGARNVSDAKEKLEIARRMEMKYHIDLPEITEQAGLVRQAGLEPVNALMIGGVYMGKAVDRHLFRFTAGKNDIIIEPPVYNKGFAYNLGSGATGASGKGEPIGHYFPEMPDPVRAEIIVPLRRYDGSQHLRIVPAVISPVSPGTKLEFDSVTPDMPASAETANRKLYRISFDLTGLDNALLDQVGIAIYWPYNGYPKYWMFGRGTVSAAAESTREALRVAVRKELNKWKEANGGSFPSDVVLAARFGDECFYTTGHTQVKVSAAVNYPLWDYSEPSIQAFRKHAGEIEYPRTWGFPEIYGEDSYGWWMYSLHEQTAALAGIIREDISKSAPELLLFRNTTRMNIYDLSNDHDGSGQELLTRNLDIVHLDPYPVGGSGYSSVIPRDMSYCAGLARRYNRPLIPWMQAHIYGDLQHVSPQQVDRMANEQWAQGADAVIWLGYGDTYPLVRPDSWEQASAFHRRLLKALPPKPVAKLAVLRSYNAWASSSIWENGQFRNPADWMLQQLLEVWVINRGQAFDVFEIKPHLTANERNAIEKELRNYPYIVSTIPWKGAFVVGENTTGQIIDPGKASEIQKMFEAELTRRSW